MAFFTPLLTNIRLILAVCILCLTAVVHAEKVSPIRAQAGITSLGQLSISTRYDIQLPEQLNQALRQGVPLNFELSYQLTAPFFTAYRNRLNSFIGSNDSIQYKLSYHPLTNRYRVSMGTFYTEYNTSDTALRAIGATANWRVLDNGTLNNISSNELKANVRLSLSTNDLPKPFQINALTSKLWQLDSGWQPLNITKA